MRSFGAGKLTGPTLHAFGIAFLILEVSWLAWLLLRAVTVGMMTSRCTVTVIIDVRASKLAWSALEAPGTASLRSEKTRATSLLMGAIFT